jgi:predicted ATPase
MEESSLRARLFGGFTFDIGSASMSRFRSRQTASLLAYLVIHQSQRIPRGRLLELLWPETSPEKARHNLSVALSSLRSTLGDAKTLIGSNHSAVWLTEPVPTDLHEFQRACPARKLQLYAGPLLEGFYESWVIPLQLQMEAEFADACRSYIEEALSRGDTQAARQALATWLGQLPEDEQAQDFTARFNQPAPTFLREAEPLIGREDEKAAILSLLTRGRRLVTLVGAGGVGKTTLALEVVRELSERKPCYVIRLSRIASSADLLPEIARSLGLSSSPSGHAAKHISRSLAPGSLVLLDNLEHLLPQAARDLDELVEASEDLTWLATSRRPTRVLGEHCFSLSPLRVPTKDLSLEAALEYPSVQLFLSRASEADPNLSLPPEELRYVVQLCRKLDGLPLAIELAASNLSMFAVQEMASADRDIAPMLATRSSNALVPHESFVDCISWSLKLLDAADMKLLKRLALIPGSLDAEFVYAFDGDPRSIARLCGHSLLHAFIDGDEKRFRILEPVREVLLSLSTEQEQTDGRALLAKTAVARASRYGADLNGPCQTEALGALNRDYPIYDTALDILESEGRHDDALRLLSDLRRFWLMRGGHERALQRLERLLPLAMDPEARAEGHYTAGRLARKADRFAEAAKHFDLGLSIAFAPATRAGCLYGKALIMHILGNDAGALPFAEESLAIFRSHRNSEGVLISAKCCGYIHMALKDGQGARYHNEALLAARLAEDAWGELNALEAMTGIAVETREPYLARRIALCKKHGFNLGLAQAYLEQAELGLGGRDDVTAKFSEAANTFRRTGHTIGVIQALTSKARWLISNGDTPAAVEALHEALLLSREFPASPNGWRAAIEMGWLLAESSPGEACALVAQVQREVSCEPGSRLAVTGMEAQLIEACALRDRQLICDFLADLNTLCTALGQPRRYLELHSLTQRFLSTA